MNDIAERRSILERNIASGTPRHSDIQALHAHTGLIVPVGLLLRIITSTIR